MGKVEETKKASSPAKRGINWLSVIGIVVLLLLIVVVAVALWTAKQTKDNPAIIQLQEAWPYINAMNDMTQAQIKDQARPLTAKELLADPEAYKGAGQYVVVDGSVAKEESMLVTQQMARDFFTDDVTYEKANYNFKGYVVDDGLVVVDITGEGPGTMPEGTMIRAFGRVFVLKVSDLFLLPWVGPDLKREFGNVKGMEDKVVFLLSKGVEVLTPSQAMPEGAAAVSAEPSAEGAAAGGTPPAETGKPAAPPEGGTPPAAPAPEPKPAPKPGEGGA